MSFRDQITKHMPVKNSTGETIGVVDDVEADRIKLTARDLTDGHHHYVPLSDVTRVDEHVHLRTAGLAPSSLAAAAAVTDDDTTSGGVGRILPWLLLALGLLALLLWALGVLDRNDERVADNMTTAPVAEVVEPAPGLGTLGVYLGGTGSVPRTFVFEKLYFDPQKSAVRDIDKPELAALTKTLTQYGTARVRIVGYADARGDAPANAELGKARADAVKAAMVASGIDAGRIETASGGETDPVEPNVTPGGRAENRRTELVLITR